MPPKRWAKPDKAQPVNPEASLIDYVCGEISSNNCLGLNEEEIRGMAKELSHSGSRKEVFDWTNTLMMGEAFAAEIIRRRVDYGPPFDGEAVAEVNRITGAAALAAASSASPAGSQPALPPTGPSAGKGKAAATMKVSGKGKRTSVALSRLQREAPGAAEAALKPGRFECGCFATVHNLRGNCANCGRIICEQEADDACYFCGLEPSRCINYEIAVQEGKISEAALKLNKESYDQAVARRDTLLEYAQNRAKRTTVIDDQSATLFSPQSAWMSPTERKQHEKSLAAEERRRRVERMHRHTGAFHVHANFVGQNLPLGARESNAGHEASKMGREAGADGASSEAGSTADACDPAEDDDGDMEVRAEPLPSLMQKIWYSPDGSRVGEAKGGRRDAASLEDMSGANRGLSGQKPVRRVDEVSRRVQQNYFEDDVVLFSEEAVAGQQSELLFSLQNLVDGEAAAAATDEDGAPAGAAAGPSAAANSGPPMQSNVAYAIRYAPTPQMRSRDDGVCLSMHQPWASLLVAGIKTHEGRVWSTDYRGRLWIHAASAQPHDVAETEKHYSQFMSPGQSFPQFYPTRVLLGYVYVTECMSLETYEANFPPEERQEASPFSFICTEPKMLPFPLPMDGNHKLFTLDRKVLVAAKKQLQEIA